MEATLHRGTTLWSRRDFFRMGGVLAGAAAVQSVLPPFAFSQSSVPPMVRQMQEQAKTAPLQHTALNGPVSMISGGPNGNMAALPGTDGSLLVDAGFANAAPQLHRALAEIKADPVKVLINTHWHFDHTDGNLELHKAGATILAQTNTLKWLRQGDSISLPHVFDLTLPPADPGALPNKTFTDKYKLRWGNQSVELQHHPNAHTDSDIAIHFVEANVIHMGDLFFNGQYPMIDSSTGGTAEGMLTAGHAISKNIDAQTKLVPGHGPAGDRAALLEYLDMLHTTSEKVRQLKKQGHSLEEVIAATPTKSYDEKWGKAFFNGEQYTAILFQAV